MSAVLVAKGRWGGHQWVLAPPPLPTPRRAPTAPQSPEPALSERARHAGLSTREEADLAYALQHKRGPHDWTNWSKGLDYHCPVCGTDFWGRSGAWKHVQSKHHPVLRMDAL